MRNVDTAGTSVHSLPRTGGVLLATAAMLLSTLFAAGPANANTTDQGSDAATGAEDSVAGLEDPQLSEEEWEEGIQELIESDMPRTEESVSEGTVYTFHVPVDDPDVEVDSFDFTVEVPNEDSDGEFSTRVGFGLDGGRPYLTLSPFEQNLIIGGSGAAITAAACAIPGIGWVGCGAVTTAVVAAGAWISTHGVCSGTLRAYIFVPERNTCL